MFLHKIAVARILGPFFQFCLLARFIFNWGTMITKRVDSLMRVENVSFYRKSRCDKKNLTIIHLFSFFLWSFMAKFNDHFQKAEKGENFQDLSLSIFAFHTTSHYLYLQFQHCLKLNLFLIQNEWLYIWLL